MNGRQLDKADGLDYQAVFEQSPALHLLLAPEPPRFPILATSNAYLKATLTLRSEIVGRGIFEVFPENPEDLEASGMASLRRSLESVIANDAPHTMAFTQYDIPLPASQGGGFEVRHWTPVNSPIRDADGRLLYIIHQVEDVTEFIRLRKQSSELDTRAERMETEIYLRAAEIEEANQELARTYQDLEATQVQLIHAAKMASLGQLVAGIAHEINNPLAYSISNLSNIMIWLEQLSPVVQNALPPELQSRWSRLEARLRSTAEGVDRVKDLVLKLRTFSRLDEGEFKTVDIHDSIESVLSFLEHRMAGRIDVVREYGAIHRLDCFPGSLNQVVMNLVSNAIEAITDRGTITLTTSNDDTLFFIAVRDTGSGLVSDCQDKIFEPFFTTKPVGEGTGLGLSISFGIMQSHQGAIRVQNRPEGGCEFVLEIPLDLESRLQQGGGLARA